MDSYPPHGLYIMSHCFLPLNGWMIHIVWIDPFSVSSHLLMDIWEFFHLLVGAVLWQGPEWVLEGTSDLMSLGG